MFGAARCSEGALGGKHTPRRAGGNVHGAACSLPLLPAREEEESGRGWQKGVA